MSKSHIEKFQDTYLWKILIFQEEKEKVSLPILIEHSRKCGTNKKTRRTLLRTKIDLEYIHREDVYLFLLSAQELKILIE